MVIVNKIFRRRAKPQPLNNAPAFHRMQLHLAKLVCAERPLFAQDPLRNRNFTDIVQGGEMFDVTDHFTRQPQLTRHQATVFGHPLNMASGFVIMRPVDLLQCLHNIAVDQLALAQMPAHHYQHTDAEQRGD